ncbi:MAG: cation diffusion facilitator family transporter [Anaerolineales bacterium]|nr:cation diffusion facilitator family transporter [Anaerolineales bacterium]
MFQWIEWPKQRFAWISVAAAIITMAVKFAAYSITGSVGLLSDALESIVNLTAALLAVRLLNIASKPPDEDHAYGHSKAEYFSSLFEGSLILIAALSILITGVHRLIEPQPIENIGLGLVISLSASMLNLAVARVLLRVGRVHQSIALEADGQHLMTDVWTSFSVLIGVAVVGVSGWLRLDAIIALGMALYIGRTGYNLTRRSLLGLMDTALPEAEIQKVRDVLETYSREGISFHALRTRQAGTRNFVSMHILIPGDWSVQQGHNFVESIEEDIHQAVPFTTVFIHMEPREDPRSWRDIDLDHRLASDPQNGDSSPRT